MSAEQAGRSLLQLPQEIRDEIYGHCFNKTYLVLWTEYDVQDNKSTCRTNLDRIFSGEEGEDRDFEPQSLFRDVSDFNTRDLADFAILRTCKNINSDARDILYSRATTFIYGMGLGTCAIYTTPPAREATDRMMNVEFKVPIYRDEPTLENMIQVTQNLGNHRLYSRMQVTCGPTLDRFAGTSIMRNSFRITLGIGSIMYNDSIRHLIESPFFRTLKRFIGFQRVSIVLLASVFNEHILDWEAKELARKVRKAFEPHLGPAIEKPADYTYDGHFGVSTVFAAEIEFEPRKFHIENLRAKATRLCKLADGLRKEANRTIDEVRRLES